MSGATQTSKYGILWFQKGPETQDGADSEINLRASERGFANRRVTSQ